MIKSSYILLFYLILSGCQSSEKKEIEVLPDHIDTLKNVTVHNEINKIINFDLEEIATFESNDEVFLEGFINDFAVDEKDNLYIVSSTPNNVGIYIFDKDANFITKLDLYGRGPGEFEAIKSITIQNNKLYAFDSRLQKFSVYLIDNYSHMYDRRIVVSELSKIDEFSRRMRAVDIEVLDEDQIFAFFEVLDLYNLNSFTERRVYKLSESGSIHHNPIMVLDRYEYYNPQGLQKNEPFFVPPFSRHTIVTFLNNRILINWTEDFLIKKYDLDANYLSSFYYKVNNAPLSLSEIDIDDERKDIITDEKYPNSWPVIHTIKADDSNRLWVSQITESDSTFNWTILDINGDIIGNLVKAGYRDYRQIFITPKVKIQNGFFYERDFNFFENIDRIVKYKIIQKS